MGTIKANNKKAIEYIHREIKRTRIAWGRAEQKHARPDELEALKNKLDVLEYICIVLTKGDV